MIARTLIETITYRVVVPERARNGSVNHATLTTFQAESDEKAKEMMRLHAKMSTDVRRDQSFMVSGGVNWTRVAKLFRAHVELDWS